MEATLSTDALDTPKSLRARLGPHQTEVATRAQVSARTITEIDAGRDVRTVSIKRVSHVLGVSPGRLLDAMYRQRTLNRTASLRTRAGEFGGRTKR